MHQAVASDAPHACSKHITCIGRMRRAPRMHAAGALHASGAINECARCMHRARPRGGRVACSICAQRFVQMHRLQATCEPHASDARSGCTRYMQQPPRVHQARTLRLQLRALTSTKAWYFLPIKYHCRVGRARGDCSLVSAQPPAKMRLPLPWPCGAQHKRKTAKRVRLDEDRMTSASALPSTASP